MALRKDPKQLLKLITYILGRRPDEFGLVPDGEGFIRLKELLQGITEEAGWRHVRRSDIDEILLTVPNPQIEIKADAIRTLNREFLPRPIRPPNLPKRLYTCVRRKAHPVVLEKGLSPMGRPLVLLSSSPEMAERIGRRRDSLPVLLTVNARRMAERGMVFHQIGQLLYSTENVPADCFSGPPLAKQRSKPQKETPAEESYPREPAGSFILDLSSPRPAEKSRGKGSRREIAWKKERRLRKKNKDRMWTGQ